MSRKVRLLMAAIAIVAAHAVADASSSAVAAPAPPPKMDQVGKTFLFDYGDLMIRVRYLSDSKLEWEQVKGPAVGLKAVETYGRSAIRPDVHFVWWQEADTSVVTQVVDFNKGRVHTTWTSPDKKLAAFQGTVVPQESPAGGKR